MEILNKYSSEDGISYKFLQTAGDGHLIETGLFDLDEETVCITTQIGCPIGCIFCASTEPEDNLRPELKFVRNLSSDEITREVENTLQASDIGKDNAVLLSYMGTGEPFLNYDNVVKSIRQLAKNNSRIRRVTIATCGVRPDLIQRLANEKFDIKVKIQLSLHAATQSLRRKLMPGAGDMLEALEATYYFAKQTGQKTKINYVLIEGVNDSAGDAKALADLLSPKKDWLSVKLMRLQEIKNLEGSGTKRMKEFEKVLNAKGIRHNRYQSDGRDIKSNCGQLRRYYIDTQLSANDCNFSK